MLVTAFASCIPTIDKLFNAMQVHSTAYFDTYTMPGKKRKANIPRQANLEAARATFSVKWQRSQTLLGTLQVLYSFPPGIIIFLQTPIMALIYKYKEIEFRYEFLMWRGSQCRGFEVSEYVSFPSYPSPKPLLNITSFFLYLFSLIKWTLLEGGYFTACRIGVECIARPLNFAHSRIINSAEKQKTIKI